MVRAVRRVGYARVSTEDQSLERQVRALRAAGCDRIFEEHVSAAARGRPALRDAVAALSAGDVLVVVSLDRLARSMRHLLRLLALFERRGAGFRVLNQPEIDTTSPTGTLTLQILGAVAEFERALIRERTLDGLASARAAGRVGGNPGLRRRDPAALDRLAGAREARLSDRAIQAAGAVLPLLRATRPALPWDRVAMLAGRRGLRRPWDGKPWTRDSLVRVARRLVADGLAEPVLLDPSPRRGDAVTADIVRAVAATMPGAGPTAIARQLEAIRQPTARGRLRWSASSVRVILEREPASGM